jgi:PAS domain S-box-containing protein
VGRAKIEAKAAHTMSASGNGGRNEGAPEYWRTPALQSAQQDALRLAAIIDSSEDAILSKDLNGIVTSWNIAAQRIFGYSPEEIIGQPVTRLIPEELQGDEPMMLERLRAGESIAHFQTVRMRKNGERIDVSLTVSPIKDEQGEIIGAAKIVRDVTQQRKIDQAALRLAAIVESSEDAIISKDLNGIITSWNTAAQRIFGYSPEEIIGQSVIRLIPAELHGDETMILAKIRAGERIAHFQTVRVRKNGERIDVSLTVSPIKDRQGKIIGAAKIVRDITQQKRLEATVHASERLASAGRLAATVAHEINNPLEAVTNLIYLAAMQSDLSEESRLYLNEADRELARVSHIAQQTLGFYRDNARVVRVSVSNLIDDVLIIFERRSKHKSLTIERRIQPGMTIFTLPGELKQIISNLVANAIDVCKDNGRIVIHAWNSRHFHSGQPGMRITVADNGTGITENDRAKLFSPFFTTKKELGTGLGLWITKDLLEKKGGHVRYRTRVSEPAGTVMGIYLPDAAQERIA